MALLDARDRVVSANQGAEAVITELTTDRDVPAAFVMIALLSYGLTAREQEVALHTVLGRTTAEVARLLSIAPFTVQDHMKAIFDKTGSRTRRELIANLMAATLPALI
ncbi:helix-turn-helix transcriptional regulator [Kibdelosporangium philippinense]|uniref:Helix-turn-helix transcriptional regulator n=1 Tax=Kibdelosporangium philippinense TaxID=211113 RepID=A0ABS8ZFI4_9PSEU|nr:helix-turn-helix transcriptional regulator [Kibdelosporangium philippinense]MCE7006187.1 helix-turn-helix transcriptional regulator [Kibdelosporangium philippinense]